VLPLEADTDFFWEQLFECLEEARVVPVVGQDLLRVSWQGQDTSLHFLLAQLLAKKLGVPAEGLVEEGALNEVACRYLKKGGDLRRIYSGLKAVMPEPAELPVPESLKKLASIKPFRLFVSTTFDPLLERALNEVRFGGGEETNVIKYYPAAKNPGELPADRPTVMHLFGEISAFPEYAVTDEDMLEFVHSLQSEAQRPPLLNDLARMQLLVLGCSFPDWLARFFLRIGSGGRLSAPRGKTDILADHRTQSDAGLVAFLESFSPEVQVFRQGGAVELIDELYRRWTALHPEDALDKAGAGTAAAQPEPLPETQPGAVFLSYASEDLDAARAIRDALEAAGMKVWFDKAALEAGDDFARNIRRAIQGCSAFLAVLSRHTLTPEPRFFRLEWRQADAVRQQLPPNRRFVIPVAIDDGVSPQAEALESFADVQWYRLAGGLCDPALVEAVRNVYKSYVQMRKFGA
jgi:hypothetical protein